MTPTQKYFLGADIGGSKTRLVIADASGRIVGFGQAGPGNHEVVGYDGLTRALESTLRQALPPGVGRGEIAGAGFGVGGLDFPSETEETLRALSPLRLTCPISAVNDAVIGLVAGSSEGWGVAIVSGTGCNCRGLDASRTRAGQVTGRGTRMGEGAGATELIDQTIKTLSRQWSRREPETTLTRIFVEYCGARDVDDLVEGLATERYIIPASAAPLIFQAADGGDKTAAGLIDWAGLELGELARAVIRQLDFQSQVFDVVLIGSMFDGGPGLIEPMRQAILEMAPRARFTRLTCPPVIGAVLLGMEAAGFPIDGKIRRNLEETVMRFISEKGTEYPAS